MSIELYPSIAKIKRNGVYENLPGFVPETGSIATQQMIASSESSATAQYVHNKGEYFRLNDTLYQAIVKINVGDSIVVGTNCKVAVIGNDLANVANSIAEYELGIATATHSTGDYFFVNDVLYMATADIDVGDSISTTSNCKLVVLADEVARQGKIIDNFEYPTRNIWSGEASYEAGNNYQGCLYITTSKTYPAGTYTLSLVITSTYASNQNSLVGIYDTSIGTWTTSHRLAYTALPHNGTRVTYTFTTSATFNRFLICAANTASLSNGYTVTISNVQLESGSTSTPYIPPTTAIDNIAREQIFIVEQDIEDLILESTNDTTDRTSDILAVIDKYGECTLGSGTFYTSGIEMPTGTTLKGIGQNTILQLSDSTTAYAVTLNNGCCVENLTLSGDTENLTLSDIIANPIIGENLWEEGDITIEPNGLGYVQIVLTNPIPKGVYKLTALVTKENHNYQCYIGFSTSQTTTITGSSIIASALFDPNVSQTQTIVIPETVYSVRLCSSVNVAGSTDIGCVWSDISINAETERAGILWTKATGSSATVKNCKIIRFLTAGILSRDTGFGYLNNLIVENCEIYNCNIGVFLQKNTEFNKFTGCTIVSNYYGYLCRGGNNYLSNCGLDGNTVNIQLDNAEGTNGGHASIDNCSVNHAGGNTGYALKIIGTGRMLINNCNFYYGKTLLSGTSGNVLTGCGYGTASGIEITGGTCSIFNGCMFISTEQTPVTRTNNTTAVFKNCYTRSGAEFTGT